MTKSHVFSYEYVYVTEVYDGDTIHVDIDLGMHMWLKDRRVRLEGINCPELDTPEGVEAMHFTETMLPVGTRVTVVSSRLDQYGRIYGDVLMLGNPVSMSQLLLQTGHAVVDK